MKKTISLLLALIAVASLFTACSSGHSGTSSDVSSKSLSYSSSKSQESQAKANESSNNATSTSQAGSDSAKEIAQKTKDYILNGQGNLSYAQQLSWRPDFLNQVDIEGMYQKYINAGGKADDIVSFATYLTNNAPVPSNWKQLFEADLLKGLGKNVSRYEPLSGYPNHYQVYVKQGDSVVSYVVVNARTGYFHG